MSIIAGTSRNMGLGIETGSITGLFNIYWMHRKGIDIS